MILFMGGQILIIASYEFCKITIGLSHQREKIVH